MTEGGPQRPTSSDGSGSGRLAVIFRALSSRNYRLFFGGQLVSLIGTFLSQVATLWLVYRLAREGAHPEQAPLLLGIVGFATQLPMFLVAPLAGVWVDRLNRQYLLVGTQTLAMLQSLILGVLALTHVTIAEVTALALFQGLINAFDMPARQAFVVEMVEDRDVLPNAIALNSTMVHAARLIGPSLAGILIAAVGEGWCFILDGVTYAGVILALLAMRIAPRPSPQPHGVLAELREGFRYVRDFVPIRTMLLLMAIISLSGVPAFQVLMPIFGDALSGYHHGAELMGFFTGASGMGALVGALYLASRRTVVGLGRLISVAGMIYGVALVAFALSRHVWLSLMIAPLAGFGMIVTFASANTLMQTLTDDEKRGRVMSFYGMAFLGMTPFGILLAGLAARHLGPEIVGAGRTLAIAGVVCFLTSVWFATRLPIIRRIIRPIYVQKGILPEVATGLQRATAETTTRD